MLRRLLESDGWSVMEAANGWLAIEKLRERRSAVILLDLMMPEMNGFQLVEELRKNADWRDILPVLWWSPPRTSPPAERSFLNSRSANRAAKGRLPIQGFASRNRPAGSRACIRKRDAKPGYEATI